jgi:hypothetical protein
MAWTTFAAPAGLSGDIRAESGTQNINSANGEPATDCTLSGDVITFPLATAGARAALAGNRQASSLTALVAISMQLRLSGAPTSEAGLLCENVQGPTVRTLTIGTDRKLRLYDRSGTFLGASTTPITTTAGQFTRVTLVKDGHNTRTWVWVDGVLEIQANSADTIPTLVFLDGMTYGERLAAGVSRGANLFARFFVLRTSSAAADSPLSTAYPDLLCAGGRSRPPTSEGIWAHWNNGTTPSPNTWQDVDEFPGNDDTDRIAEVDQGDFRHVFRTNTANPLPADATVVACQIQHVGRVLDAGKDYASIIIANSSGSHQTSLGLQPTTTYRGFGWAFDVRPDGGAWTRADFDPNVLHFGVKAANLVDEGAAVTSQPGPIAIYYTSLLPQPTLPARRRFVVVT